MATAQQPAAHKFSSTMAELDFEPGLSLSLRGRATEAPLVKLNVLNRP